MESRGRGSKPGPSSFGDSVLENANLKRLGLDRMPPWQEALAGYLAERNGSRDARQASFAGDGGR